MEKVYACVMYQWQIGKSDMLWYAYFSTGNAIRIFEMCRCICSYFVSTTSSHYDWAMKKIKAHKKMCI